eukprot:6836016-Alexandrium_andersonii.AAC.1
MVAWRRRRSKGWPELDLKAALVKAVIVHLGTEMAVAALLPSDELKAAIARAPPRPATRCRRPSGQLVVAPSSATLRLLALTALGADGQRGDPAQQFGDRSPDR